MRVMTDGCCPVCGCKQFNIDKFESFCSTPRVCAECETIWVLGINTNEKIIILRGKIR